MSGSTTGRIKKAAVLVPLAMLSAAWTVNAVAAGSAASADSSTSLPDGTVVPTKPIEVPASVSQSDSSVPGIAGESASEVVDTASVSGIPAVALAAYQRAETTINQAAPACHLPWQLLAAIGRVESDHGRAQGNTLSSTGIATPGIFGPELNGANGTQAIADTDGGRYDGDTKFDRAVGPMQFIPSTWSVVGVDANGDGQRNPQDINDAALAAAVYLCSGSEDLSTQAGQQSAVARYNHSSTYVDEVLAIEAAYKSGDYTSVPNFTVPSSYFVPAVTVPARVKAHKPAAPHHTTTPTIPTPAAPSTPAAPATPAPKADQPTAPAKPKSGAGAGVPTIGALPSTGVAPLDQGLAQAQAVTACLTGTLGTTITGLIPNAASLSPATLVADLQNIPVVGAGLVNQLTTCVAAKQ